MLVSLLKMIIVDDERLIRELLKGCIDWGQYGIQIVGESSNTKTALRLVDTFCPDIVFADVCMPGLDGIEFSKMVIEKHPNIKIVILTGHNEFEYAKRSIKVGIADFLLKPINPNEIVRTVCELKAKIEKERMQSEDYERYKQELQLNMPELKEKLYNDIIQGHIDLVNIKERIEYFGLDVVDRRSQVAVIEALSSDKNDEEQKIILNMRCMELTRQFFRNDKYVHIFFDNEQKITILCNEIYIDLWNCCETIKSMVINRLKCFVCIGIGNAYNSFSEVWRSYREACDALKYRFIIGENQVISFCGIYPEQSRQFCVSDEMQRKFVFCLKSGLDDEIIEALDNFYDGMKKEVTSIESAKALTCSLLSQLLNVLIEMDIQKETVLGDDTQPFEAIFKLNSLFELKTYIKDISFRTAHFIRGIQGNRVRKIVQDVKDYLTEHYSDSTITLSGVAEKFYTNSSYLSRVFKEETSLTFGDYLFNIRMQKALDLLNDTDMMAYEVAEKVGIKDSHYFSVCFKKYIGMSIHIFKRLKSSKAG